MSGSYHHHHHHSFTATSSSSSSSSNYPPSSAINDYDELDTPAEPKSARKSSSSKINAKQQKLNEESGGGGGGGGGGAVGRGGGHSIHEERPSNSLPTMKSHHVHFAPMPPPLPSLDGSNEDGSSASDVFSMLMAVLAVLGRAYYHLQFHDGQTALEYLHLLPPRHFYTDTTQHLVMNKIYK
jgi:hypothetical protein